jgi:hypothetical protein
MEKNPLIIQVWSKDLERGKENFIGTATLNLKSIFLSVVNQERTDFNQVWKSHEN